MNNGKRKKDSKNMEQLRKELYKLIESEALDSDAVQSLSKELDGLILEYYRKPSELTCQKDM